MQKTKQQPTRKLEVDMTPMADVTFLLLIFFMVTASFVLQSSFQQTNVNETGLANLDSPTPVEVFVDSDNQYVVIEPDGTLIDAHSDREMRTQLRSSFDRYGSDELLIRAHVDSTHSHVVTAWEAGVGTGFNDIKFSTTTKHE